MNLNRYNGNETVSYFYKLNCLWNELGFESLTKTVAVKEQIIINNENSAKYTIYDSDEADRSLLKKRTKKKSNYKQTAQQYVNG